jgi:hypothetical protein
MLVIDNVRSWTKTFAQDLGALGTSSLDTPIIGNWCYVGLVGAANHIMEVYIQLGTLNNWADDAESRMSRILSWDTIKANILWWWPWLDNMGEVVRGWGSQIWPWLNTIDDKIRSTVLGAWTWLNTIDDRIRNTVITHWYFLNNMGGVVRGWASQIWPWLNTIDDKIKNTALGTWTWLNTIDDKIISTAKSRWAWLDTIDDRIRDIAWNHVASRLGAWMLDWLLLNLTVWAKVGYRILDKIWDMEWDETNKEAK